MNIILKKLYDDGHKLDKLPILVSVHGGAMLMGDRKMNLPFRIKIAQSGYLVYSLEYRLLNETDFFGVLSDVCRGLQFVKDSADSCNGNTDRIYVMGESAGALPALYAAAMTGSDKVRRQMGVYCPEIQIKGLILSSGMLYTTGVNYIAAVYKNDLYGPRKKDKEFMKYMNPEKNEVLDSLPKVCLTTGRGDFLRSMSLHYAQALKKPGIPICFWTTTTGKPSSPTPS